LPFQGGLDTETPPWQVAPGTVRSTQNFEVSINGGYSTHAGYERFDGNVSFFPVSLSLFLFCK